MKLTVTEEEHKHLPAFDNTKLVAINTCPTWGILRYEHHKTFGHGGRAMALEAGGACHEAFAALRFADLYLNGADWYGEGFYSSQDFEAVVSHGETLFGASRYHEIIDHLASEEDQRVRLINVALAAFDTSGFYDDPRDKRRTTSNIQEALIAYVDRYPFGKHLPIVAEVNGKPFVGIEIPFDLTVYSEYEQRHVCRFTGRIDGLHFTDKGMTELEVVDNKTASRLDDAWASSFELSHQFTGYMQAARAMTGFQIAKGRVHGLAIPLPRTYDYGGVVTETFRRKPHQFDEWDQWFWHTYELWKRYKDNPSAAPKYTHSCNRYFRSCSFIPYCASPPDERPEIYDEMVTEEWSPLKETSDG